MTHRLQVGIDFSQKRADLCLLFPAGEVLEAHQAFANACSGYSLAKQLLLAALDTYPFDGVDVSGEATGYYWLPFFLQLAADPNLAPHDLKLFLLNPRWVRWVKKCFAQDDKSDQKDPFYIAERTRTHPPALAWSPALDSLPFRFYTRLRLHVVQNLAREKCYGHVGHDVVEETVRLAGVVERQDVGMLEVGGDIDFAGEPLRAQRRHEVRLQHLEPHLAVVLQVLGQVDRGHAPTPQLALDRVAVLQRLDEAIRQVGQEGASAGALLRYAAPRRTARLER